MTTQLIVTFKVWMNSTSWGTTSSAALIEINASRLPLSGTVATAIVPFGSSVLTLVISPMSHLAGRWSELLPWGILVAGLLFTIGLVAMTERLIRQRQRVEQLAEENRRLYGEQRNVSLTLQQSLLPKALPTINGVEFVAGFIPGRDWYSAIAIDDHRFAFVLGDVSAEGWLRRQSWRDFANISCVRFTY